LSFIADRMLSRSVVLPVDGSKVRTVIVPIDADKLRKPAIDQGDSDAGDGRTRWPDGER